MSTIRWYHIFLVSRSYAYQPYQFYCGLPPVADQAVPSIFAAISD